MSRRISLASGVLPEFDALTVTRSAVAAGYTDAGLMIRPRHWNPDDEGEIRDTAAKGDIGFLDVEVLWIPPGGVLGADHRLVVDAGKRLGADHVLVVSDEADAAILAPALRLISEWCDGEIQPVLEFLRITRVQSLPQAHELLSACAEQDFEILLDATHLARSNGFNHPLLRTRKYPYIQLCDGPATCADDHDSLLADALDHRVAPGEGRFPLQSFLAQLPAETPLSLEVRSSHYRNHYPDPIARAHAVLVATRRFLA